MAYIFITKEKTNWKYLLITFILALIVIGESFLLLRQEINMPETRLPEKVEDETADWKTYRNEEYGFEIKYPKGWQIGVSAVKIKKLTSDSYFEIIENNNENKLTLDEWFKKLTIINGRPTIKAGAQPVFINGIKAYRLDSELEPPNPLFEIVGIADSQMRIFTLFVYSGELSDNKILEQMLSTFRFLE